VVAAGDAQTAKGAEVKPDLVLLTGDSAIKAAAAAALASGEFKGDANETLLLHGPAGLAAKRLLIVGLGKLAKATPHSIRSAVGTAIRFVKPRGIRDVTFALPEGAGSGVDLPPGPCSRAAVEGAMLADYDPDTYRSDRKDQSVYNFTLAALAGGDAAAIELAYAEGVIIAESQNFARELVNEPGNKLTPTKLGERAAAMAATNGLTVEVYSTEKLHELKMGAFWSVSQGSAEPPALIVLTYEPDGYVRYWGHFHQAGRQDGADEVRHGRLSGNAGRDGGHWTAQAQGQSNQRGLFGGEHARRQSAEARGRADGYAIL